MEDVYEKLAVAIIEQAAKDYIKAYRALLRHPTRENKRETERIEQFFRSQWFSCLSELDGDYFINRIQKMEKKKRKEGGAGS